MSELVEGLRQGGGRRSPRDIGPRSRRSKRNLERGGGLGRRGHLVGHRRVAGDHLAEGEELLRRVPRLIERGVVVVGGHQGQVAPLVVRAVGQPEVGAAVEHVDVDRGAGRQQLVEVGGGRGDIGRVMHAAPPVEPSVPELRAHQRTRGLMAAQGGEPFGAPGAEGSGLVQPGEASVAQHPIDGLIHGRQRNGDPGIASRGHQRLEIGAVGAVGAVLVLDLHQDHRPTVVDLPRCDDVVHAAQVGGHLGEEGRSGGAQSFDAAREPHRQSAVVPLGADVGAGAHDRVEALRLHQVEESPQIVPSTSVPLSAPRFVRVPGDVGLDRVQSHQPGFADAVAPLVGVHAEVVDGAGDHLVRLSVAEEVGVAEGEGGHVSWCFR